MPPWGLYHSLSIMLFLTVFSYLLDTFIVSYMSAVQTFYVHILYSNITMSHKVHDEGLWYGKTHLISSVYGTIPTIFLNQCSFLALLLGLHLVSKWPPFETLCFRSLSIKHCPSMIPEWGYNTHLFQFLHDTAKYKTNKRKQRSSILIT
jgi:hypothetical protein